MAINNARRFVEKMRQDQNFRKNALATTDPEDLLSFLRKEDLLFDQKSLLKQWLNAWSSWSHRWEAEYFM